MENLPRVLPGYYHHRGTIPYDSRCCRVYNGPNGSNPIPNGYASASLSRPLDYGEKQIQQRCAIGPAFSCVIMK